MKNPTAPDVVPVPPDPGTKGGKAVKAGGRRKPQSLKPKDGMPTPPDPGTKGGGVKNVVLTTPNAEPMRGGRKDGIPTPPDPGTKPGGVKAT